jgi:hypothetical protein
MYWFLLITISFVQGTLWGMSPLPLWAAILAAAICGWFVPDLVKFLLS